MVANPIATFYEVQAAATADIVRAALDGAERIQKLTLQAMRPGTAAGGAPSVEQGARFQREVVQAFADMNNEIVRASYSMLQRMRDALGATAQSSITLAPTFAVGSDDNVNPMAMYDTAMRQWQTAVQQMMETPSLAVGFGAANDAGRRKTARFNTTRAAPSSAAPSMAASKPGRARKRKSTARKR